MAVNEYDNETFFEEYTKMTLSQLGLAGAGEDELRRPMMLLVKASAVKEV